MKVKDLDLHSMSGLTIMIVVFRRAWNNYIGWQETEP